MVNRLLLLVFFTLSLAGNAVAQPSLRWDTTGYEFTLPKTELRREFKPRLISDSVGDVTLVALRIEGDESWQLEDKSLPIVFPPTTEVEFELEYVPRSIWTHRAILIAQTLEAGYDTLTLSATAYRSERGGFFHDHEIVFNPVTCSDRTTATTGMSNDGVLSVMVDSIVITGADPEHFRIVSSTPPGRIQNFELAPSTPEATINYLLQFDPLQQKSTKRAELVMFTKQGRPDTTHLVATVPESHVLDLDTTISGLTVGVDHVVNVRMHNAGNSQFTLGSIYYVGDLDASIAGGISIGDQIIPEMPAEFSLRLRSEVAGTQTKTFRFNGVCDDDFDLKITATFVGSSNVEGRHEALITLRQEGDVVVVQHHEAQSFPYRVIDITGREVASGLAGNSARINLSELLAGVYVVSVEHPTGRQVLKFKMR